MKIQINIIKDNVNYDDGIRDVLSLIQNFHKELSKKCVDSYNKKDIDSGRWWDCQACAISTLERRIKEFTKENGDP